MTQTPMTQRPETPSPTTAGAGLDRAFAEDMIQRWLDAWNSKDADRLIAMLADGFAYEQSGWPWPTTMCTPDDVRTYVAYVRRAAPDLRIEITDGPFLLPDQPKAAVFWRFTGTHTGVLDPPGLKPTGKRYELTGAECHEYRDGRIVRVTSVCDMAELIRQIGVLPPKASREERLLAKLTNLRNRLRRLLRRN